MTPIPRTLLRACADVGPSLTPAHAEALAHALDGVPGRAGADDCAFLIPAPAFRAAVTRLLDAWSLEPHVSGASLGSAVAAAAHAHALARRDPHVELVMSGPATYHVHARLSDQVLLELIESARTELMLVTYALYMYEELRHALTAAADRGVEITVLAETPEDRQGFNGDPEQALFGLRVKRLRWASVHRPDAWTSLHAKIAIADRATVLVTSANLTSKAAGHNMEAGLLITGGKLPARIANHFGDLARSGVLTPV